MVLASIPFCAWYMLGPRRDLFFALAVDSCLQQQHRGQDRLAHGGADPIPAAHQAVAVSWRATGLEAVRRSGVLRQGKRGMLMRIHDEDACMHCQPWAVCKGKQGTSGRRPG
jgi:hypothetical protein